MLDFKNKTPSAIEVDGVLYPIKTDFQYWVMFSERLNKGKIKFFSDVLFLFENENKIPTDFVTAYKKLLDFLNPPRILPRPVSRSSSDDVILDYSIDADLIFCAILEQYGIDLTDEKLHLHWWKFCALLSGLHNTKLNEVMGYRSFNPNDKTDYKKSMSELKEIWRIETELTREQNEALAKFDAKLK